MQIVEIKALHSEAHDNRTHHGGDIPDGWAIIPEDMELPNFPFGEVEAAEVDGVMTVTKWTAGEIPAPAEPSPTEQRENSYNTQAVIDWDGEMLTVTQAAQLWQYYAAEGSEKANELQALIAAAKADIRAMHPDEGEVTE